MTGHHKPRFEHTGGSTHTLLDSQRVLGNIGLKKGDTFLDAGSGSGYLSIAAAAIVGEAGKVYAVDIDTKSIDILKGEISRLHITNLIAVLADMTRKTPLADNSIDTCLMANVLHGFVENDETSGVMKEINRLLKRSGTLAVVEFKKLVENTHGPPFEVKLSPEQVTRIVIPSGYSQKQVVEVGLYHYAAVFARVK